MQLEGEEARVIAEMLDLIGGNQGEIAGRSSKRRTNGVRTF
jgi:hypothetical protein